MGRHWQESDPKSEKGYNKTVFECATCALPFVANDRPADDPKFAKRRYCSRDCYEVTKQGASNPNFKGGAICPGCQVLIIGRQRVYCSKACRKLHVERRRAAKAPMEKLNRNMRWAVLYGLSRGVKNKRPWTSLTGFTDLQLREHLEKLFLPGMTWENYGTWHIDHVKPVVTFQFTQPEDEQFKACWALTNLQPLWGVDNFKKGSLFQGARRYRSQTGILQKS